MSDMATPRPAQFLSSKGHSKSVTFHPETHDGANHASPVQANAGHDSMWESRESTSGHLAQDGGGDTDDRIRRGYYARLYRFYEKYNPDKVHRVAEYLSSYRGEEEQLFAILVGKYGPEPEDYSAMKSTNSLFSSEADSVMHYSGKRCRFPKKVAPHEGNTDCETPYWAGSSSLISERHLLSLLLHLETPNVELQKCYMGLFAQHPAEAWNGMTYVTRTEGIAEPNTLFLGHVWVGTLGSGKIMIHEGRKFQRITLYCTEECQKQGNHDRWRLSVYRSEVNSLLLLRTVWDPIVVPEPLPLSRYNYSEREFHSSSEGLPSRLSSASSDGSTQRMQPQQPDIPPVAATLAHFAKMMENMEHKIMSRLIQMEGRLSKLEEVADR